MPYRRQDSAVWWVSLTDSNGQRIRRTTGTTNRKEAQALEAKWKLEAFQQQHWDQEPTRTFEEVMLAFLQATQAQKKSAHKDRLHVRNLRVVLGGKVMNTLNAQDVRQHIDKRKTDGVSNYTINRELEVLSAAINYCNREWEWQLPNPVKGRKLKEPECRIRWLTQAQATALIHAARSEEKAPHLAEFITLALNTGMRRSEMLELEWTRVDLQSGLIYLEGTHTKSGKRRTIPLNETARQALCNRAQFRAQHCVSSPWVFCHPNGDRITDVKRSFATACKRAGITDFRIHDMRHTCAAWLVSSGVPLTEVRDLLGHSTVKMTEKYAHLAPENVRNAVNRLDGLWSRSGHSGGDRKLGIVG